MTDPADREKLAVDGVPPRRRIGAGLAGVFAVAVAIALYTFPVVSLWNAAGRSLPAWSSSDIYLYLNLSHLRPDANGMVRNPWYGNSIEASKVGHLRFGLALRLFHLVSRLAGGDGAGLVVWHALLTLAIALALLWLLRAVTDDPYVLFFGFAVVIFVNGLSSVADLSQLRRGEINWIYGLPFSRAFFPQVAIPLVLGALGAMLRWLHNGQRRWLAIIAVVQFLAFLVFPYGALVILGAMAFIVAVALGVGALRAPDLGAIVVTVAVSLFIDALWCAGRGSGVQIRGARGIFAFDLARLQFGTVMEATVLLGAGVACLRGLDRGMRAVFGGFALSLVVLPLLFDAFVSPALLVTPHILYFAMLGITLPLVAFVEWLPSRVGPGPARVVASAGIAVALVFAVVDLRGTVTAWRPYNTANGELARALTVLGAGEVDLVVVPVHGFRSRRPPQYWEASWVPLLSRATVLYSSAGVFLVPAGAPIHLDRLAAYLFLAGEDDRSIQAILDGPPRTNEQTFLAGFGRELLLVGRSQAAMLAEIRRELIPRIDAVPRDLPHLLAGTRRVIIADYRDAPQFRAERIEQLFTIDSVIETGVWRVRVAHLRK